MNKLILIALSAVLSIPAIGQNRSDTIRAKLLNPQCKEVLVA